MQGREFLPRKDCQIAGLVVYLAQGFRIIHSSASVVGLGLLMNIKSLLENRVGSLPLKSFLRRIPMAHFKNGEYGNNKFTVKPIGWRRFFLFNGWTLPYFVLSKPTWRIEIKPKGTGALPLREFDIYERVPPFKTKKIMSHRNIGENVLYFDFTKERDLSEKGNSQYWLGEVGGENSFLLVDIDVIHGDNVFVYVVLPLMGALLGAIIGSLTTVLLSK